MYHSFLILFLSLVVFFFCTNRDNPWQEQFDTSVVVGSRSGDDFTRSYDSEAKISMERSQNRRSRQQNRITHRASEEATSSPSSYRPSFRSSSSGFIPHRRRHLSSTSTSPSFPPSSSPSSLLEVDVTMFWEMVDSILQYPELKEVQ